MFSGGVVYIITVLGNNVFIMY